MTRIGCHNVPGFNIENCCQECHEDHEEFGYSLGYADFNGNEYDGICCAATEHLERMKNTNSETTERD